MVAQWLETLRAALVLAQPVSTGLSEHEQADKQRERLFAVFPDGVPDAEQLARARVWAQRLPWLFRPPMANVLARALTRLHRLTPPQQRIALLSAALFPLLAVALLAHGAVTQWGVAAWEKASAQEAAQATALTQKVGVIDDALASLPATPQGIADHVHDAREAIRVVRHDLGDLHAWAGVNISGAAAYQRLGEPSGAALRAALKHDATLLQDATYQRRVANSELLMAQAVQGAANRWNAQALALPADLPDSLVTAWEQAAQRMASAISRGDVTGIQRAQRTLDTLARAHSAIARVTALQGALPMQAMAAFEPQIAAVQAALQVGSPRMLHAAMANARMISAVLRDQWVLRFVNVRGQPTVIVRQDVRTHATQCFAMVAAYSPQGKPISVPIFDTERQAWVTTHWYGVQISLAQYRVLADAKRTGTLASGVIGSKAYAAAHAIFDFPTMAARIAG